MGLFKSIKKAFKKVTRGIKKVVKKTVRGIKKVVKKISSSKILKALAIAAAVVVTGGAAVAAFTGGAGVAAGTAGSTFANWMMTTSAKVTGGSLFGTSTALARGAGTVAKVVASPFKAIGTTLGSTAATVTDFTGLTTEAGRTGFVPSGLTDAEISQVLTETPASIASSTTSGTLNLPTTLPAAGPVPTQLSTGTLTMPTTLPAGTSIGTSSGVVGTQITGGATAQLSQTVPAALNIDPSVATQATQSWSQRNPRTADFLTNVGTGVATSVATGYAMQQIAGDPEETGSMAGLRTEGASSFDPLRVYAAERGIADSDISKYFTFGNTAEAGNMPLFQQQTIGVA
jgi:hypothetical protein